MLLISIFSLLSLSFSRSPIHLDPFDRPIRVSRGGLLGAGREETGGHAVGGGLVLCGTVHGC